MRATVAALLCLQLASPFVSAALPKQLLEPPLKPPAGSVNVTATKIVEGLTKSRVLGDVLQVDVPFDYRCVCRESVAGGAEGGDYFNTYLNSECYPAVGAKPPSLGFPGSCPPTLPWSDPRLAAPPGCSPDQVALKWWGTAVGGPAVLVSWTTCTSSYVASGPVSPADPAAAPSVVRMGKVPGVYDTSFAGVAASYTMDYSQEYASASSFVLVPSNGGIYVSPIVHHTLIRGLVPGEEIFYLVEGPAGTTPFAGQFKVPGGSPTRVGIVSDSGQTANTSTTFDFLAVGKPDLLVIVGDLTYADNTGDWNMFYNWTQAAALSSDINTFSPRWDAFGRLLSPLASSVPILTTPGNHEIEQTPDNAKYPVQNNWQNDRFLTRFGNYLPRYPAPQTEQQALNGPSVADLAATTPSDANQGRNLWYSTVIPGVATQISLSTYTFTDTFTPADPQYQWLQATLAAVDREKTPWIVVQMHASFYSTWLAHAYEVECMRAAYEPLFREYGVDIVWSGHDHAVERSGPVYNYTVDEECGTIYIVTGFNGDEVNFGVVDASSTYVANPSLLQYSMPFSLAKAQTCVAPTALPSSGGYAFLLPPYTVQQSGQWGTGGTCVTAKVAASGNWCPTEQPAFSRYREAVYGAGFFDFLSPTKAVWSFYSQGAGMVKPSDKVVITRGNPKCPAAAHAKGSTTTLADTAAAFVSSVNASALAKAAGGSVDVVAGVTGVKRATGAYVGAKLSSANFTAATLANTLRNKTGGFA